MVAAGLVLAPLSAEAGVLDRAFSGALDHATGALTYLGLTAKAAPAEIPPAAAAPAAAPAAAVEPAVPVVLNVSLRDVVGKLEAQLPSAAVAALPEPTIQKGARKLFCVEFARIRSGLDIFGDAKLWWSRAKNLYARVAHPVEESVMVFSGSKRLVHGHVAVVTQIVSAREIRVDQANWENHGEIGLSTPVLDVSKKNDWSQVRVWNQASHGFGARVYAISGFIARGDVRQASLN